MRSVKGTAPEIYTVPAAGGVATRLTRNTVPDLSPTWSPDGTHIAFTRFTNAGGSSIIVAASPAGSETTVDGGRRLRAQPDLHARRHAASRTSGSAAGRPSLTIVVLGGGPTLRLLPLTPAV